MNSVEIIIENELHIIGLPEDLKKEVIKSLTMQNPAWVENKKMGRWNRTTPKTLNFYRQPSINTIILPKGYIYNLLDICNQNNIRTKVTEHTTFFTDKKFNFNTTLKPFQEEASHLMLRSSFGVLCAPTGAGKTVMALYIIAKRKQPALVIVHTKELLNQWIDRVQTFLGIPANKIGVIGSGQMEIGEKITIALVQTLYKHAKEVANHIGLLIVDECHRCPSRTFTEAVTSFPAAYMMGLSATPWRRDGLGKLIFYHLGPLWHEIKSTDMIEEGHILQAKIFFRNTKFIPTYDPVYDYSRMLSELTKDEKRNNLICSDIMREIRTNKGTLIVLTDRKEHCFELKHIIKNKFNSKQYGVKIELLTGDVNNNERKKIVHEVEIGAVNILIATGQLIGEGFDCRELAALFLSTPIGYKGRTIQYLGRILRPSKNKNPKVFDYVDINVETLYRSARGRQQTYKQQGHIIKGEI